MIHRTQFTITVLSNGPLELGDGDGTSDPFDLLNINYAITEGHCVGQVELTHQMVLPNEAVRGELIRLGNDGEFFDDELGEEPELLVDRLGPSFWQCYSSGPGNELCAGAVRQVEEGLRRMPAPEWANLENEANHLYNEVFPQWAEHGATDTEPRGALCEFFERLAGELGVECPYESWEGWLS